MIVLQSLAGFIILDPLRLGRQRRTDESVKVRKRSPRVSRIQLALAVLLLKIPLFKRAFSSPQQPRHGPPGGDHGGHLLRLRLPGGSPRPPSPASNASGGDNLHPGRAGPPPRPGHECPVGGPLLLEASCPFVVRELFVDACRRAWASAAHSGSATAANIFVGMIEAPLFIRPYMARMTRSEIFAVMTCGMATIAGTVMVLYASILERRRYPERPRDTSSSPPSSAPPPPSPSAVHHGPRDGRAHLGHGSFLRRKRRAPWTP